MNEPNEEAPSARGRWAVGAAFLALGAGLAGGIALGFVDPPRQARRLPHGATLELRGWTFAPGETFIDGSFWQQAAQRLHQPFLQLGGYRSTQNTGGDLALWFRTSIDPPVPGYFLGVWIDGHGCRLATQETPASLWTLMPQQTSSPPRLAPPAPGALPVPPEVRWVATPNTRPRRGTGPLTYALIPAQGREPLATFTVPRPREPTAFPQWTGRPVPVQAVSGDITFILTHLRHHAGPAPQNESTATFRCLGPDAHATSWEPALVTVSDATGNRLITPSWRSPAATFRSLCPHEPAWKLQVRFARPNPADVPPDAEWTWRNLPLTARDLEEGAKPTFRHGDVSAHLDELHREPGKLWDPRPKAAIVVSVSCPEGYQLTLQRATDQHGRPLGNPLTYAGDESKDHTRDRTLNAPSRFYVPVRAATRRLSLTFALHRTRTVEFTVRP